MMVDIKEWTPNTTYGLNEVVLMFNKLYISLDINKDILPIPVVSYSTVNIEGSDSDILASNLEEVLTIARSYYPDVSDADLIDNNLNTKNIWIALQ